MINERMGWSATMIARRSFRLSAVVVSQIPARSCPEGASGDAMTPIFLSAQVPSESDWSNLGFLLSLRSVACLTAWCAAQAPFGTFRMLCLWLPIPRRTDHSSQEVVCSRPLARSGENGDSAWICPVVPHRPSCQSVRALFLEGFPAGILDPVFISTSMEPCGPLGRPNSANTETILQAPTAG